MENQTLNNPHKLYLKAAAIGMTLGLAASTAWNAEHSPATPKASAPVAVDHLPEIVTPETTVTTAVGPQPEPIAQVEKQQTTESSTTTPTTSPTTETTPSTVTPTTTTTKAEHPRRSIDLRPEIDTIDPNSDVAKTMAADTVHLDGLGCSGFLVRDDTGKPIGVLTAEHCSLRDSDGTPRAYTHNRTLGSDNKMYDVFTYPIIAQTGDSLKTAQDVGTIDKFIVAPYGNQSIDIAIGAFQGVSTDELLKAYEKNQLSSDEISQLKFGDTMYMSGWPANQPKNPGAAERQEFGLTILGTTVVSTLADKSLPVVIAAAPMDKDGAICSFGASGSEGFIKQQTVGQDGKPITVTRSVGTLSFFDDLTSTVWGTPEQAAKDRAYYGNLFNVDLSNMAVLCGFSYELPTGNNRVDVQLVKSHLDIPGYIGKISPLDAISRAQELYDDPQQHNWNVIDGLVKVSYEVVQKGGPDSVPYLWVKNPMLFTDPDGSIVLGWYNPDSKNYLTLNYFQNPSQLEIFPLDDVPHLVQPKGDISWQVGVDDTSGEFVDGQGLRMGGVYSTEPNTVGQAYKIVVVDGQPQLVSPTQSATNQSTSYK